jgi:hypothetical protein
MTTGQVPHGVFVIERYCECGFMVDHYDSLVLGAEFTDPDTGLTVERCPECDRDLTLQYRGEEHRQLEASGDTLL